MRLVTALFMMLLTIAAPPLAAQEIAYEAVGLEPNSQLSGGQRYVPTETAAIPQGVAAFGPFRVLGRTRAALVDVTDEHSPAAFEAMVRAFPQIALLEMVECPGTEDDRANLRLGRMIRQKGLVTYVPAGGSVRSGGVELFLAGVRRMADSGAEFAVHAWMDEDGAEATDYAAAAPQNRKYLDYYRQMGMSEEKARAFYAMTNSVPHAEARWLDGSEMAMWVGLDG
ncbi:MAG: alpha/beta hydrolase [Sphingomonadaceae bacterium]|nr:alpha/beta hydrolase [Sphingomonadaceae bacterium]